MAVLQLTVIEFESSDFVPVMVWELEFVGEVTESMVGWAGAVVSNVIASDIVALDGLPAASINLT